MDFNTSFLKSTAQDQQRKCIDPKKLWAVFLNCIFQLYFSTVFQTCIFWLKFGWSQFDGSVGPNPEEVYKSKDKRINCELWQRIIWTALCLFPFPLSFPISTACSEPSSTWASLPGKDHRPWTMGCVNRHCGPNRSDVFPSNWTFVSNVHASCMCVGQR